MAEVIRVQVLFTRREAERFAAYCQEMGYKKSPLIVRLVREHMDREGFARQGDLIDAETREPP
ncbi:MAG: hypothetical protein F4181_03620 [Proteobacteria bacterium]|nr:hypothetical protein [Pseudomonadota bacterium]